MDSDDRRRVLETHDLLAQAGAQRMDAVYERLFRIAPETKALFIGDMGAQMTRFWSMMEAIARDGLAAHAERLRALGRRHAGAGVEDIDHAALCAALVETLSDALGEAWTEAREDSWGGVNRAAALAKDGGLVGGERLELPTSSV